MKVVGLNPGTPYWMDIFSHIFVVKICNECLKRPKINKKEAGLAHLKNVKWCNYSANIVKGLIFVYASFNKNCYLIIMTSVLQSHA